MWQRTLTGFAALFMVVASGNAAYAACTEGRIALRGAWGTAQFSIALADTALERSRGLMFVEKLPKSAGMLFVYPEPVRASFWMKNTLIPLDMIFADARGVVKAVHSRAIPGDLTQIEGGPGILAVLEINGGLAEAMGIGPGTELQHEVFSNGAPSWSC